MKHPTLNEFWAEYQNEPWKPTDVMDMKPLEYEKFVEQLKNSGIDISGVSYEKRAVIEPGRTPPEKEGQKSAADLEDDVKKRLSDGVAHWLR
jgi:hypothetical protein